MIEKLEQLAAKLNNELGTSVEAGTARSQYSEVKFEVRARQIWMLNGGGSTAFIDSHEDGGFTVEVMAWVFLENSETFNRELQDVAEERMNEEMWPRVSDRGYRVNPDDDTWDDDDNSFVRYGTLTVPGWSELLDELRHLANASLTETWDV